MKSFLALLLAAALLALPGRPAAPASRGDAQVSFDLKTMEYHCPTCPDARVCGRHCVVVLLSEAVRLGGRPCPVCGGVCSNALR